ncbi:MAG: hypothetical protein IJF55_03785, partial [Clostridia bacterium]|nr:hypothetical protein [Clostridia bacterium]
MIFKRLRKSTKEEERKFREDLAKVKGNPFLTEEELQPTEITEIADKALTFELQLKALKQIEA